MTENTHRKVRAADTNTIDAMDSDERRNKIVVGVVVIVVAVAIVALILLKTSGAALTCQLSDVDPSTQKANQKTVSSSPDDKALASFDGYLKYELADKNTKKTFLPLELASVQQVDLARDGLQTLVLNLNCAQLNITLKSDKDELRATDIQAHLSTANADNKFDSCTVGKAGLDLIVYAKDKHFACESFELVCEHEQAPQPTPTPTPAPTTSTTTPGSASSTTRAPGTSSTHTPAPERSSSTLVKVVTFAMRKLEFELNGNADKHKKLVFDTQADGCKKQ